MMKIKSMISNIIIVFLLLVFAVAMIICVSEIQSYNYNEDYYRDEDSFLYAIQEKDYSRLVEISNFNKVLEKKENEKMKSFHAVADYFEAAAYYKAYQKIGDLDKAEKKWKIMEQTKTEMGEFSYLAEEMLEELEIEGK